MCRDTVSIVRKNASNNVYELFMKLYNSNNEIYILTVVENIRAFAVMQKYSYR